MALERTRYDGLFMPAAILPLLLWAVGMYFGYRFIRDRDVLKLPRTSAYNRRVKRIHKACLIVAILALFLAGLDLAKVLVEAGNAG